MTEFVINSADKILKKLGSVAFQEVPSASGLRINLKKLLHTVSTVKVVLFDAGEQLAKDHSLRVWLEKLKDAFYDVEDMLDEFECEALRRHIVNRGSTSGKVRYFFSSSNPLAFHLRMGHKIKVIGETLDEIASLKSNFHLVERLDDRSVMHMERVTHPYLVASHVIGRDGDKENIIDLLIGEGDDYHVSVIPIVAMGGMGKTTLAKMVYNDDRVARHFDIKMWVCVSDDFHVQKLIKEMIASVTRENCVDLTMELLNIRLRETLGGKKFLLILDDVWNEDRLKWTQLKDLLRVGATGSKILVTTRSLFVASIMGTVPPYNLEVLSHEDCMSLFERWAFREGQAERYPNLIEIGTHIVEKCKGLPLAVRTLASLLYSKTDEREWLFVRDNDVWGLEQRKDDILPVLKLSYDQMPNYLRLCFAYCSMFPKDYMFNSLHLIQFWMAHGLLQSSNEDEELERVGMRYIKELRCRCFFQEFDDYGYYFEFKMHDLVHDLALSVMRGELSIVNSQTINFHYKVRHLSFSIENWLVEVQVSKLRTVIFPIPLVGSSSQSFVNTCIRRFKYLRMLDLSDSFFKVLPSFIDTLKYLRYLDLSRNLMIRKLPGSIYKLQNLQTLTLTGCMGLEKLPDGTQSMVSLRFLEITTRERRLQENGIRCLNSLRFLSFYRCYSLEYLFDGMQHLNALRTLRIIGCPNLISLPHCMKYLTALENLVIVNCERINLELEGEDNDQNFSGLKLQMLWIDELLKLVALPQWLLQGSSSSLQFMHIGCCFYLKELPEWLQSLSSLQKLEIECCYRLSSLPKGMRCLSALEELKIKKCPKLFKRCERGIGEDWPKIAHVPKIEITN